MRKFRRALASILVVAFTFILSTTYTSFTTSAEAISSFDADELAVVNFAPTWGDKEVNINSMIEYIEEAHEDGVKMIVFPEMCVTGYASSSDINSEVYKMAVSLAEPLDGPTARTFTKYAKEYGMWIIYGATEKIEGDDEHAYNSAFACSPEGTVVSYQKITPVEGDWCTPGETPVILDTEWGKVGLSICYDTYATPELERYYAAKGCGLVINPTATSRSYRDNNGDGIRDDDGWEWYYKNRLESIVSRDGLLIASANLVGEDGPKYEDGSSSYNFPGGSVIVDGSFSGAKYYAGTKGDSDIITGVEGLLTNDEEINMSNKPSSTTKVSSDFHPDEYAKWYAKLAEKQEAEGGLNYYSDVSDGPVAAVANCSSTWGDKEANIQMMINYIEEAAENNVDILVFPETILTGYSDEDPLRDIVDGDLRMHVELAETIPGPSTELLSEYAKEYGMYIVFGMTEKDKNGPMYEEAKYLNNEVVEKVYNSAAILYPDGRIESYQKMHRAGVESNWSVCGTTPYMFDTEWGKIGVDICRDGHFYPELGRYYAAMGCTILIHPTATTGNPWYRESRMGSYTDRDNMAVITCNVLGPDGIYNEETGKYSGGIFNSTSLIITKYSDAQGNSFNPYTGSALNLNGTGSESEGYSERGTSPQGLEIAKMDLTGTGFRINNFNPLLFSRMYDELAVENIEGYETLYPGTSINKPVVVKLVEDASDVEKETTTPDVGEETTTPNVTDETKTPSETTTVTADKNNSWNSSSTGSSNKTGDNNYVEILVLSSIAISSVAAIVISKKKKDNVA